MIKKIKHLKFNDIIIIISTTFIVMRPNLEQSSKNWHLIIIIIISTTFMVKRPNLEQPSKNWHLIRDALQARFAKL